MSDDTISPATDEQVDLFQEQADATGTIVQWQVTALCATVREAREDNRAMLDLLETVSKGYADQDMDLIRAMLDKHGRSP